MAGLYIHFPFCKRKCPYCGFASRVEAPEARKMFLAALIKEMNTWAPEWKDIEFSTLYFGGGTPSLLEPVEIGVVLDEARKEFDLPAHAEVTLEANPESLSQDKVKEYRELGVDRLSLGVQAFQDEILARIRRIHSVQDSLRTFSWTREAGFTNLSIDLMFALPGQTLLDWEESLGQAVKLGPEHISLYGLTLEPGTPLEAGVASGRVRLAGEELEARMYERACEVLERSGYEHYEISNFAKPGFRSKHNSGYWSGEPYLGLGPSAHSFRERRRWANASLLQDYLERVSESGKALAMEESLTLEQLRLERIFLGLRQKDGVMLEEYERNFGESPESRFRGRLPSFLAQGWVIREADRIMLSDRGMVLSDAIFEEMA
jgi:oxygen-independent coproporphyrinogen-3 oxidase